MADREYKINLKIEADASGSAPVDAGLKRVSEEAKKAEESLKKVEEQSKRTEQAVRGGGGAGAGSAGARGLPGDGGRSWDSPDDAVGMERVASGMRNVTTEASAMEGATARAAAGMSSLGTGAIAAGGALTLVVGAVVAGAAPEIWELGGAVGDLASRFTRAASEATGLPNALKSATNAVKEFSGAAAEERGEEQKLMNAKLDAALARQKVTNAAREEKEAVDEVTLALREEQQALANLQLAKEEASRTDKAIEGALFDQERARLQNTPGLSREERATRAADIERRALEAEQTRQKADLERRRQDEQEKLRQAEFILAEARRRGNPAAIQKAADAEDRTRDSVSTALIRLKAEEERLAVTGPIALAAQRERAEATILAAREADSQEVASDIDDEVREYMKRTGEKDKYVAKRKKEEEKAAAREEKERMSRLRRQVTGDEAWEGSFDYSTRFPTPYNNASTDGQGALAQTRRLRGAMAGGQLGAAGNEYTLSLIGNLEQAAAGLADGSASTDERAAFNQALTRLAEAVSKVAPGVSSNLRGLKQEMEQRLLKIEADVEKIREGSTK